MNREQNQKLLKELGKKQRKGSLLMRTEDIISLTKKIGQQTAVLVINEGTTLETTDIFLYSNYPVGKQLQV